MNKKNPLKKLVAYIVVLGITTSMMCQITFASDKLTPIAEDTFNSQSTTIWGSDTLGGNASKFIKQEYVEDAADSTDYSLKLSVYNTVTFNNGTWDFPWNDLKFYHGTTAYNNGAFTVNYTPLNITGDYYASLYFRALGSHNNNFYRINLYNNKADLVLRTAYQNTTLETNTYSSAGIGETLLNASEYEIKVSFNTVDSKNYFKVYINNVPVIDYSGDVTAIETDENYLAKSYLGIGLYGTYDSTADTTFANAPAALFDDLTVYDNMTNYIFNAKDDFSSTGQGPYWYYMGRQYTDCSTGDGKINGNLFELTPSGDAWGNWFEESGGITVNDVNLKPSGKTHYLSAVKVFKAPYNGVITIATDGNIILGQNGNDEFPGYVQITRNSEVVWPTSANTEWMAVDKTNGVAFEPMQLRVSKGDEIGFVAGGVWANSSWRYNINWIPTVKYNNFAALGTKADLTDGTTKYPTVSAIKSAATDGIKNVYLDVTTSCDDGSEAQASFVFAALYDSEGNLVKTDIHKNEALVEGEYEKCTLNLGTTDNASDGSYIKLFLLNGIENLCPVMKAIKIN